MARLPQPGGDDGNWGEILNEFITVSHATDGTLKSDTVGSAQIQAGAIDKSDIGLGNVNNTADADKPVSTATQIALNEKLNTTALNAQVTSLVADTQSTTHNAIAAVGPRMSGPLGRWRHKLATDPDNAKVVLLGDSTSDASTQASTMYRRLLSLHTQQGEALSGLAKTDFFTDGLANGTATFISSTANFTSSDAGRLIHGRSIPAATKILSVQSPTSVTLSANVPSGSSLQFWVGRHIISGGNNGVPLIDWFTEPSLPSLPYNRNRLVSEAPDLTIACWLINDVRRGALGTTINDIVSAGTARLKEFIEWHLTTLPNTDILLRMPNTFLTANVGGNNFVTDGSTTNPQGLAQIYSTALCRIYLNFVGKYNNVDVIDIQSEVFGTQSFASHPLLGDQIHPNGGTSSDIYGLTPVGGGYVATADALAKRIGFARNAFPPMGTMRTQSEYIIYEGPTTGTVRLISRDYTLPAPQSPVFRTDTLYISDVDTPLALSSATIDRTFGVNILQISGLTGINFSPFVGRTATVIGNHAPATTGDRQAIFIDLPSIAAGGEITQDVTVSGVAQSHLGHGTGVVVGRGNGFRNSGLQLVDSWVHGDNTVRLVLRNPTGAAVDVAGEVWTFWVVR